VAVDNAAPIEPGMLFVVHPNQFLPQTGYMMCGEPVVVGPRGPIVLSAETASLESAGAAPC
jgi:Xaa-Pro dipeptidase